MSVIVVFLYTFVVVVSLLLIGLVLIQPAKSGGMGAAFGGIGESVFGGKAGSHLTKATVVMTVLFFVLTLTLAALIGRGGSTAKLAIPKDDAPKTGQTMTPTAPTADVTPAPKPASEPAGAKK